MTTASPQRLLGVFAHPDDETIGAGALLALAARGGHDVSVVTCTRGERGEVVAPELAALRGDGPALAARREQELDAALVALGVDRHLFLDQVPGLAEHHPARFVDSGMMWVRPGIAGPATDAGRDAFSVLDVEVLATLLAVVVRQLRPTVVLTEEPGGGYGHPDHVQAHRVTMRAVELAAGAPGRHELVRFLDADQPWRVPTVAWVAMSREDVVVATDELAERLRGVDVRSATGEPLRPPTPVPDDAELPSVVVPAGGIAATLDARGVVEDVLLALRAHHSQVQAVAAVPTPGRLAGSFALADGALHPLLDRAYVRLAPGYALPADLLVPSAPGGAAAFGPDRGPAAAAGASAAPNHPAAAPVAPPAAWPVAPPAAPRASGRPARRRSLVDPAWPYTLPVAFAAGLITAALGTVVHRFEWQGWPVGMVLALVSVLAASTAARAFAGYGGTIVATLTVVFTTQAMTFVRPGGDVLVTGEPMSYAWLLGAPVLALLPVVLPTRWFADARRRGNA
ncbi:PIG-L family deacetylase [Georgenia faecalis]|uniref:PIG-L family deacetylase n=1 Tax=Georgenia faecalis TaxID=2483799 RepID=A0ABV9D5Y0_9MICO|nr:PIG-L family deacetylase [Georgenia faecalis]